MFRAKIAPVLQIELRGMPMYLIAEGTHKI